jgi:hypothetical protein
MLKKLAISIGVIGGVLVLGFVVISIWTVLFDNPGTA